MSNDEGNPNDQMTEARRGSATISSFGFRHSFVIRHSGFVI
jgi:hypothetical protein